MASMLRVVLVTCVIFACFQCDRTTGNVIGDTGVREDNNELVDVLQRNKKAAVRPMNDAGNAQFGQQNFANPNGNALNANNAPQIPNGDFNGAGNGFAGGNQAWNAPMAGGQGGGMNPNNFGGPQGNLNKFNMPQNMQNQPAFNQAGMQNNLPGAGQDGVGNNRGGLGKMMAKEMRNRKAQMANAMRPLQIADTEICRDDVMQLCGKNARGNNFAVLDCLQNTRQKLSQNCENYVKETMEEGAMDYRMDAELKSACKEVVKQNCRAALEEKGTGSEEECLKSLLEQGKLTDHTECQTEVIHLLQESRADIQLDPLLHKACALDIKHYCSNIPQGEGRHMSCLLETLEDKTCKLRPDCLKMLTARKEMWEFAAKVAPPETINDFVTLPQSSPNRNYFPFVFLAVFGTLFFGGMKLMGAKPMSMI